VRARGTVKPSRVCFLARWPSRKAATACPRPDPADHGPQTAADGRRMDRGGTQLVPAPVGAGTSGTGTPPACSMRSASTPWNGWPVLWVSATNAASAGHEAGDLRVTGTPRLITLCGTVIAPGRSGPGGHRPNADGEERRRAVCGKPHATVRRGGAGNGASATAPALHPTRAQRIRRWLSSDHGPDQKLVVACGVSPVRVVAREPGSRLAVWSGNGPGRSPASKATLVGATERSVASSEACRVVRGQDSAEPR